MLVLQGAIQHADTEEQFFEICKTQNLRPYEK